MKKIEAESEIPEDVIVRNKSENSILFHSHE